MTRLLSLLSVLLLAALAWAGNALGGNVIIHMPVPPSGSVDLEVYFEMYVSQNSTAKIEGVTFTYDPETGLYHAPSPDSSTWEFSGGSIATHVQWPPFPALGPPTTTVGSYETDD